MNNNCCYLICSVKLVLCCVACAKSNRSRSATEKTAKSVPLAACNSLTMDFQRWINNDCCLLHCSITCSSVIFFSFSEITNLGVFRFYAETYLKQHPMVDPSQTILMKQKPFEGNGLPLQIYLYTKNNQFVPFEHFQSEILEHLFAIMGEFGLKGFQQPTGEDMKFISNKWFNWININTWNHGWLKYQN